MTTLRICFVGDSITNGTLDDDCLGWPGRICSAARTRGHDVTLYNLGVRAETTGHMRPRWRQECEPRLPAHSPGALIFAFGVNDMAEEKAGLRCPKDESLANARAMITEAKAWRPVLWVGPAPAEESMQPLNPAPGVSYSFHNARTQDLSAAYAELAAELDVPYLDVFSRLIGADRFFAALKAGDGVHPTADGYALIAEIVSGWPAWRAWFGEA